MTKRKPRMADTFAVWGEPPLRVTELLTPAELRMLKHYIDGVVKKCYRIAYDCGAAANGEQMTGGKDG